MRIVKGSLSGQFVSHLLVFPPAEFPSGGLDVHAARPRPARAYRSARLLELYIWRFFCQFTDPVVAAVAYVTPKATAPVVIWLFGVVWLFWLRLLLLNVFLISGVVPRLS